MIRKIIFLICIVAFFPPYIHAKENRKEVKKMQITSKAFKNGDEIPKIYTCDDKDISPPLEWSDLPESTKSLVLIVDDPDAPDPKAPKMTWVHWVLYNIPLKARELPEAVSENKLPEGTRQALNDWKRHGYGGPCPPIGTHRYFHKLYALDTVLPDLGKKATKQSVEKAMEGHVIAKVELVGKYKRH